MIVHWNLIYDPYNITFYLILAKERYDSVSLATLHTSLIMRVLHTTIKADQQSLLL